MNEKIYITRLLVRNDSLRFSHKKPVWPDVSSPMFVLKIELLEHLNLQMLPIKNLCKAESCPPAVSCFCFFLGFSSCNEDVNNLCGKPDRLSHPALNFLALYVWKFFYWGWWKTKKKRTHHFPAVAKWLSRKHDCFINMIYAVFSAEALKWVQARLVQVRTHRHSLGSDRSGQTHEGTKGVQWRRALRARKDRLLQ